MKCSSIAFTNIGNVLIFYINLNNNLQYDQMIPPLCKQSKLMKAYQYYILHLYTYVNTNLVYSCHILEIIQKSFSQWMDLKKSMSAIWITDKQYKLMSCWCFKRENSQQQDAGWKKSDTQTNVSVTPLMGLWKR